MDQIIDCEDGLPLRPHQNPDARYEIIQVGRGGEAGIIALTTTEAFRLSLPPDFRDSWREIGAGPYLLQTDFLGFRQYLYGYVTGHSNTDLAAEMVKMKERYLRWRDRMQSNTISMNICHDICHDTASIRDLARRHRKRQSRIRHQFIFGLSEYSRVNHMDRKYKP